MSGFNLAELLPFYLDETDEHIAGAQRRAVAAGARPDRRQGPPGSVPDVSQHQGRFGRHGVQAGQSVDASPREPVRAAPEQEAIARPADAGPDVPLPGRAARLPPRPACPGQSAVDLSGLTDSGHRLSARDRRRRLTRRVARLRRQSPPAAATAEPATRPPATGNRPPRQLRNRPRRRCRSRSQAGSR